MTLTDRTTDVLQAMGYHVGPCQLARLGAAILAIHSKQRDILLVSPVPAGATGIRVARAMAAPELRAWLVANARYEMWEWLPPRRGERAATWTYRRQGVGLADIPSKPSPVDMIADRRQPTSGRRSA